MYNYVPGDETYDSIKNSTFQTLGLDSLDVVDFTYEVEKEFCIELSQEERESITNLTVEQFCDMVLLKVSKC